MNSLGERLYYARKSNGYTQCSLADSIGVSRGVIFNLEKNKTKPQTIVVNAICDTLNINKEWLVNGTGKMDSSSPPRGGSLLTELYESIGELSEKQQIYLLNLMNSWHDPV